MGLTYRGTNIQTANIFLDVHEGYAEPATVRGKDGTIPGKAGRFARNRVKDYRKIELRGEVIGTGVNLVAEQQSWRNNTDTLMALLNMSLAAGALVLSTPTLGLPASVSTTLATSAAVDDIIDTAAAHGYSAGTQVTFTALTGGAGLTTGTSYYVIAANLAATTFQVSATLGGAAVNFTTDITAGTVATVTSRTITARCVNIIPGPIIASRLQRWTIELEAVGDPPDWA